MSISELQEYTFATKYARYNPRLGRRETFVESVDRVFEMHEQFYKGLPIQQHLDFAKSAMKDRLVLGSQRALQFGGSPILRKHARMYNCSVSYCDRPRFFQEALWMLLCGCGVGFSVQAHHVNRLPSISRRSGMEVTYQVQDSIEGWADALGVMVSSYFQSDQPFPEFSGKRVSFDYSLIRPQGASLSSGMGKAPGSAPLKRSLMKIQEVFEARLVTIGSPCSLRPIDAYDIIMHASDAVLAGGVRRSATICLFSADDDEMCTAKTGDWFTNNPQRGRSNNSALLVRNETSKDDFLRIAQSVKDFGEPGFVWADNTEVLYNPCVEIGMYPVDIETGESGWQVCNLTEINMKAVQDEETFMRACKAAAILGTFQAGYTSFEYLGPVSERIIRREALLGCSMTGMMDSPSIAFDPDMQRKGAALILEVNEEVARIIGINKAARATCVKPAGTTSCILGTASGIHPHHASRYFRRVQANISEMPLQYFKAHNPRAVETCLWNPNKTDDVITFCVEIPDTAKKKNDLSAIQLLEHVRLTQNNWVAAGKRPDACAAPWLSHNVSNTITVRDHEWDALFDFIYEHRHDFAGISLLPEGGDLDYPQAPFTAVWTAEEILREYGVGSLFASGLIVDGLHAFSDDLWGACDAVMGRGAPLDMPQLSAAPSDEAFRKYQKDVDVVLAKKDWVRRAHKFAQRYYGGDVRRMIYCLKRVHNCKLWEDLKREYVPVDYSLMLENTDTTKLTETVACAGGKCDI
jgi:ribonucleoside-diphosphate reductase alpha chain